MGQSDAERSIAYNEGSNAIAVATTFPSTTSSSGSPPSGLLVKRPFEVSLASMVAGWFGDVSASFTSIAAEVFSAADRKAGEVARMRSRKMQLARRNTNRRSNNYCDTHKFSTSQRSRIERKCLAGCSKRPSCKAAASEEVRHTLFRMLNL